MKKLLVANRGEIALRVMRTAKEMGIQTVAVYSEADRQAKHVRFADEAVLLGPPPSNQSYLLGDKILEICKELEVDAIHPGYGFLSENAGFARKVKESGITFVGPSAEAMEIMGSKLGAKEAVKAYGVPMVPGLDHAIADIEEAKKVAIEVGYPILIKASAGGGGKGMRVVNDPKEFEEQMKLAVSEATASFGDGAVFIEKYVGSPRHIEIQVLGDNQGNIVYLFERECSIQRRHQKLVEEAPSAVLTPELRKQMGEAAVNVAKACNYTGAGTVEFLVDETMNFYFLEMNTRLQVEHPVTEMITGLDLVREQIRIARGESLGYTQEDLSINGHAIELRICAEDPSNNFLPEVGKLETYRVPMGTGVRVDDGFEEGMDIPIYYDNMIAKLIVYASDREKAIERMKRAISEYEISGIATTLEFGEWVMNHEAFKEGQFDTKFIDKYFNVDSLKREDEGEMLAAALAATLFNAEQKLQNGSSSKSEQGMSEWRRNRTHLR
ncbi:MAG: acetyl-CoA carboxylase biotin carboxylase subunit [Bacteroidetes bacterium]|nr:acetyl-CoA carboxylase biotin carboxylase subunit [Bacteroidota bacterium]